MSVFRPLAFALGLAATPLAAFDLEDMTDAEREAFRAEIRAYLLDNPEVLMEAIGVLEQRRAVAEAEAAEQMLQVNAQEIFDDGYSWVGGNPEGSFTIVEFLDYRCGYCRRAHPEVARLIEGDGDIRIIVKEFPILGEQSTLASKFAIATKIVAGDAAYGEVSDALMTLRADVTPASLRQLSDGLGLDTTAILSEMDSAEVNRRIAETRSLAQRLQINGTPSFVFEDQLLRGYVGLEEMQQIVAEIRAEG